MRSIALVLATCLAGAGMAAHAQDPLKSTACDQALGSLQAARGSAADPVTVEAARRGATQACLGGAGDARRPAPVAQAPLTVPPPTFPAPVLPTVQPLPPPVPIGRPTVITTCDPGGCWDSNGTRLNRSGPLLVGPGGACSVTGGFVHCR